jgi:hypothetical protein
MEALLGAGAGKARADSENVETMRIMLVRRCSNAVVS